jgi:chromosome segregation ATPase
MPRPVRDDSGDAIGASARELFERTGAARADVERAEQDLAALRARQADLAQQLEAVQIENANLERELIKKLHQWRKLDDATVRADEVLPQLRAVTGSLTYRGVRFVLHAVNRAIGVLTLRGLRRR